MTFLLREQGVAGSIPVAPISFHLIYPRLTSYSRTLGCQGASRRLMPINGNVWERASAPLCFTCPWAEFDSLPIPSLGLRDSSSSSPLRVVPRLGYLCAKAHPTNWGVANPFVLLGDFPQEGLPLVSFQIFKTNRGKVMSARVNIDDRFFTDIRVQKLARALNPEQPNLHDARGRLVGLWYHCYEHEKKELCTEDIDCLMDCERAAEILERCGLAEKRDDNVFYIKGSHGRIEWLGEKRRLAKKAIDTRWEKERTRKAARDTPGNTDVIRTYYGTHTDEFPTATATSTSTATATDNKNKASSFFSKLWASHRVALKGKAVREMTKERAKAANARWKEHPEVAYWEEVITRAGVSPFVRGERKPSTGHKQFRANIDWFLKPGTHVKILEGVYEDDAPNGGLTQEDYLAKMHAKLCALPSPTRDD